MILDPNRYTAVYPAVKRIYERDIIKPHADQLKIIAELSISSTAPVLAITLLIQRDYGTNSVLEANIETLISFYHYTNVVPFENA
jgi:hypothetical protein